MRSFIAIFVILGVVGVGVVIAGSAAKRRDNDCPTIKLKRQWGGRTASALTYQIRPIRYVIVHHTVSKECASFSECSDILQNTQHYHMNDLNYDDIGFNFLIGNDGVVYEGTGWGVRGSHTYGYNMNGTGIAFIGNFSEKLPSRSALNAAKKLLACGVKMDELDRRYDLIAALQVSATKSPGLALYNEIQNWDHWRSNA